MKMLPLLLTLVSLNIFSPSCASADTSSVVRICGTIYRAQLTATNNESVDIYIASFKPQTNDFAFNLILSALNPTVQQVLDNIKFPNSAFIGCVFGPELPKTGYKGDVLLVESIQLQGQTSAVSIGK